jgi:hypothetical protein
MIQKGSDASFDVDRLALVDMHLLDGHDVDIDLDVSDRAGHAGHTSLHQGTGTGTGTGRGGGQYGHFVSPVGMPLKDQHRQWHVVSPPPSSQTSRRAPAAVAAAGSLAARSGSMTKKGSGPGGAGRRPDDSLLHEVEAAVAFVNALVPSPAAAPAAVPAGH